MQISFFNIDKFEVKSNKQTLINFVKLQIKCEDNYFLNVKLFSMK